MYGGYRYAPHHYQQPSISGVTPQAVETNSSLELIHRAKMSEFSAFKVQTSNEKAVMRFQIKVGVARPGVCLERPSRLHRPGLC